MLKNITLSAEEKLIEAARDKARQANTTLNAEFRRWLAEYALTREEGRRRAERFRQLLQEMKDVSTGGRKFTREEMNER